MESHRLLPFLAGVAISAALLWLGAGVFAMARARNLRSSRPLVLVAVLVAGCGLWWPGHFLEPAEATSGGVGGIPIVAAGLALALAGLAGATALVRPARPCPLAGLSLLLGARPFAVRHPGLCASAVSARSPAGAIWYRV
jgi:hypothetical protein